MRQARATSARLGSQGPERRAAAARQRFRMPKRVGLAAATAFLTVNIWTGCPLFAIWVGAQVVTERRITMASLLVIVVVLGLLVFASAAALAWLNATYDELIGRPPAEVRPAWLRSMRSEAERHVVQRVGVTALERLVMLNVYLAVIALTVWFVFFAGPPFLHG